MDALSYIETLAAVAGLVLTVLLCVFPRFGTPSWVLALTLVPAALASAVLGVAPLIRTEQADIAVLSFACLIFCAAIGCLASYMFERADFHSDLKKKRWLLTGIIVAAPILVAGLYAFRPASEASTFDRIALGPFGYGGAGYLVLVSVVILANIEQTLRNAEEYVRWEIKFLLLGIAATFSAIIYIASQVLLYPAAYSYLPWQALRVFPIIFLCACSLILLSWRRSTGKGRVVVSQGVVYSTITLFSVGVYLVAASLLARWLSAWVHPNVPLEPIIFLVSAIVLSAVLLGTSFRHGVRRWVRRNFFAGNYDYRKLWMDATETVRSIDSPAVAANALAQLIHDALGSIDVSVWLKARDAQVMHLTAVLGTIAKSFESETLSSTGFPPDFRQPVNVADLDEESLKKWPSDFLQRSRAALVVPLISSGRMVGLLTVGPDRSRKGLDLEAREFLRVLAVHAASEFHKCELLEDLVQTREAEAFRTFSTFLLHDLKNFSSTLSLIAKNAVRHHGNPDFHLDAFRSVLDTAEKMKHLCNGLRTFSTTLAANKTSADVNDIVKELTRDFEVSLSQRLRLNLSPVPKTAIDRQEFSRVLQNLILNANEACPKGWIELSTSLGAKGIVVCVIDQGKGIPKEFLEKELFQPFHTTKADGLGIGLFQSKKIIEAHDGTIEVESKEGEGTVVRIVIPLSEPDVSPVQTSPAVLSDADSSTRQPLRHVAAKS